MFGRAGFGGAAKGLLGNFGLAQTLGMTGLSPGAMGGQSPGIFNALKRGFGNLSTGAKFARTLAFGVSDPYSSHRTLFLWLFLNRAFPGAIDPESTPS